MPRQGEACRQIIYETCRRRNRVSSPGGSWGWAGGQGDVVPASCSRPRNKGVQKTLLLILLHQRQDGTNTLHQVFFLRVWVCLLCFVFGRGEWWLHLSISFILMPKVGFLACPFLKREKLAFGTWYHLSDPGLQGTQDCWEWRQFHLGPGFRLPIVAPLTANPPAPL